MDISKGGTRFCNVERIVPEANKIFADLGKRQWLEGLSRDGLVQAVAESYGDLNVIHPFRDGNGRAQRLLFEQMIINAGFEIDWWRVERGEWLQANVDAVECDYDRMEVVFDRCIGGQIA